MKILAVMSMGLDPNPNCSYKGNEVKGNLRPNC